MTLQTKLLPGRNDVPCEPLEFIGYVGQILIQMSISGEIRFGTRKV